MDFLNLFDIKSIQLLACACSCMLALLLALIRIPKSEYSQTLTVGKNAVVISFLLCALMMIFSLYKADEAADYEMFSTFTMLIVTTLSSVAISYSMISILNEKFISANTYIVNVFMLCVFSVSAIMSYLDDNIPFLIISLAALLILFIIQNIFYILQFNKAYKKSIKTLNDYYDEHEEHKLKWIRFCYIIGILVNLFILVYIVGSIFNANAMKIYILWYILYMIYFSANFISFIGSHKIVLEAFAQPFLSGRNIFPIKTKNKKEELTTDKKKREREFAKLAKSLDIWVANKRYREYDKTREEIADELSTSKEVLQLYFLIVMKQDFRSWRNELRINDTKKMLIEDEEISINAIREQCGFSDRSNFYNQFTKVVGCSPKKWRETNGKISSAEN